MPPAIESSSADPVGLLVLPYVVAQDARFCGKNVERMYRYRLLPRRRGAKGGAGAGGEQAVRRECSGMAPRAVEPCATRSGAASWRWRESR
eukprot:6191566-Pleurochrysis_carterae.AAC.1